MGGRGTASNNTAVGVGHDLGNAPYNLISFDDKLGGAVFPFLEQTKRAWRILTHPVGHVTEPHPGHIFGKSQSPTLRWVNGQQVSDLYVDGMDTTQFLQATGLELDMHKGGFVLSKRISRVMRPHRLSGFFAPTEVQIAYMKQTPAEAKIWDGAGLISRRMLQKMILSDNLPPAKREQLTRQLRYASRVEFTIMTPNGQDKGHAMVAEHLRDANGRVVDFLLPQDTKKEACLHNGRTFVGLNILHGHNQMRLDIQSLINLHPFFEEKQLLNWLKDEGDLFIQAVETGEVAELMARIDRHTTLEEVEAWPLREYLASGGHPIWFRSHVKALLNQHLKRLNHSTLEKMRLPIPGGRYYVMPVGVGHRAGMKALAVPRGHIHIDDKRGTAWVNDQDWLTLPDSPKEEGIATILGGADNDDALWLHPFTDYDGQRKVLAWRSPNQVGEYVVLKPTAGSHAVPWTAVAGEVVHYPPADGRKLPPRIDFTNPSYLELVNAETAGGLGEGHPYTVDLMEAAMVRAVANQGALGMYCNSLMLNKALYGRLPSHPPAPLEAIIDSAVKTGADLSQVVLWNYANSRRILESKIPIPNLLHPRLSINWADKENLPPLPRASGKTAVSSHWLDELEGGVKLHIQMMQQQRERLVRQARPPEAIFDWLEGEPEAIKLGSGFNALYAATLRMGKNEAFATVLERAKAAAMDYLAHFPPERRQAILLGALAAVYEREDGADTAVWLGASKGTAVAQPDGRGNSCIAHETILALRARGLLGELIMSREGVVLYTAVGIDHM